MSWQRTLAHTLRRMPWAAHVLRVAVRMVQPRVTLGVVGVLLDADRAHVLLVEHVFHPQHPWGLPGGWMNRGEDPAQTIVREFAEETGLRVHPERLLLTQRSVDYRQHIDVVYLCALDGAEQTVRLDPNELLAYRWVAPADLPPLIRLHQQGIQAAFGQSGVR